MGAPRKKKETIDAVKAAEVVETSGVMDKATTMAIIGAGHERDKAGRIKSKPTKSGELSAYHLKPGEKPTLYAHAFQRFLEFERMMKAGKYKDLDDFYKRTVQYVKDIDDRKESFNVHRYAGRLGISWDTLNRIRKMTKCDDVTPAEKTADFTPEESVKAAQIVNGVFALYLAETEDKLDNVYTYKGAAYKLDNMFGYKAKTEVSLDNSISVDYKKEEISEYSK